MLHLYTTEGVSGPSNSPTWLVAVAWITIDDRDATWAKRLMAEPSRRYPALFREGARNHDLLERWIPRGWGVRHAEQLPIGRRGLHHHRVTGKLGGMPDRPFRAVDELIRRVQRIAADRPDPIHILAQMISMIGASDVDPYAVIGVLIEGAAHTVSQHVPAERQEDTAAMVAELLAERLQAHGCAGGDRR
jgi:hypothetical protein